LWIIPQSIAKISLWDIFAISYDAGPFRKETTSFTRGDSFVIRMIEKVPYLEYSPGLK